MRRTAAISISMLLLGVAAGFAETVSGNSDFEGRWSRDCDQGRSCHLEIGQTKSKRAVEITFSVEGNGPSCRWSVDAVYDRGLGGPVARDPHGNYYFYLTRQQDGRLYSSGTMLPNCGPQPTDQYFTSDDEVQVIVDNREVFDHNGSAMIVSPSQGTIVYRDPKQSIGDTVKHGALLFKASASWDPYDDAVVIRGTAYVFKRGCEPAPYEVSGRQHGWHTLVLKGAAPVRAKSGCQVVGYKMNGNSTLKFSSWGD